MTKGPSITNSRYITLQNCSANSLPYFTPPSKPISIPDEVLSHIFMWGAEGEFHDGWCSLAYSYQIQVFDEMKHSDVHDTPYGRFTVRQLLQKGDLPQHWRVLPQEDHKPKKHTLYPILVSHVSKAWRGAALATRDLWRDITIGRYSDLERARVYIERSGTRPLDIFLNCTIRERPGYSRFSHDIPSLPGHPSERYLTMGDLERTFSIIEPVASRWRSFTAYTSDIDREYMKVIIFGILADLPSVPKLETLDLCHEPLHRDEPVATTFPDVSRESRYKIFGGDAPSLKRAIFSSAHIDWTKNIRWLNRLEELELHQIETNVCPSLPQFKAILENSPNLVNLELGNCGPGDGDEFEEWGDMTVTAPSVKRLVLREFFDAKDYLVKLLKTIHFPNLNELHLDASMPDESSAEPGSLEYSEYNPFGALSPIVNVLGDPLLGGSGSCILENLVALQIENFSLDDDASRLLYQNLPRLITLDVNGGPDQPCLGILLLAEFNFLPDLQVLVARNIPLDHMMKVVWGRRKAGNPILELSLPEGDITHPRDDAWFRLFTKFTTHRGPKSVQYFGDYDEYVYPEMVYSVPSEMVGPDGTRYFVELTPHRDREGEESSEGLNSGERSEGFESSHMSYSTHSVAYAPWEANTSDGSWNGEHHGGLTDEKVHGERHSYPNQYSSRPSIVGIGEAGPGPSSQLYSAASSSRDTMPLLLQNRDWETTNRFDLPLDEHGRYRSQYDESEAHNLYLAYHGVQIPKRKRKGSRKSHKANGKKKRRLSEVFGVDMDVCL